MKSFIVFLATLLTATLCLADNHDPNGYFKDRSWNIKVGDLGLVKVTSEYRAEPIMKPNKMKVRIKCAGTNKTVTVTDSYKYCGVDSVSVLGDKLVLMLTDYDPSHPQGYCVTKRRDTIQLPKSCSDRGVASISKKKNKKKKKSK